MFERVGGGVGVPERLSLSRRVLLRLRIGLVVHARFLDVVHWIVVRCSTAKDRLSRHRRPGSADHTTISARTRMAAAFQRAIQDEGRQRLLLPRQR